MIVAAILEKLYGQPVYLFRNGDMRGGINPPAFGEVEDVRKTPLEDFHCHALRIDDGLHGSLSFDDVGPGCLFGRCAVGGRGGEFSHRDMVQEAVR